MPAGDSAREFQLKALTSSAIPAALERGERYRFLNEPAQAESICLDILALEPSNQQAIILLLLALTDQFSESISENLARALALLPKLTDEYQRIYYQGIINEREARVILHRGNPGAGHVAYDLFREAMEWYERAEKIRPAGNDEALLRWNTCARTIMVHHLETAPVNDSPLMLE